MDAKSRTVERLLFCYPGSKRTLAPQYVKLFPAHSVYVSPFVGTAAEFTCKYPSKREIINDLDGNIYSVFAVLRNERWFKQLLRLLKYSHDCRRLYFECRDRLKEKGLSILERAFCFLVTANLGFQGIHPLVVRSYSCGLGKKSKRIHTVVPALQQWRERMKHVECENIDAFDLIEKYDDPQTLFFLDPPYHLATRKESLYLHDIFDHGRFVRLLQRIQGKAFLCGYEHGLYDVQLMGWRRVVIPTMKSMGGRVPRKEIVWMNYDEHGQKIQQDLELIKSFEKLSA
jgi:DNA adenine methylase